MLIAATMEEPVKPQHGKKQHARQTFAIELVTCSKATEMLLKNKTSKTDPYPEVTYDQKTSHPLELFLQINMRLWNAPF